MRRLQLLAALTVLACARRPAPPAPAAKPVPAAAASPKDKRLQALVVRVDPEGDGARVSIEGREESVLLDGRGKKDVDLDRLFQRASADVPDASVIFDAPSSVHYDQVIQVLDSLHKAGFTNIAFESFHP